MSFTVVLGLKANTLASESKLSHKFYEIDLPTFESHMYTYIDTIGVPREVPDEFKAHNQIAAGF